MFAQNEMIPMQIIGSELHYWREIFDKYDRDKDDKIPYVELKAIIQSSEYQKDLPDNVVKNIMSLADTNSSGYLYYKDFLEMAYNPGFTAGFRAQLGNYMARYVDLIVPPRQCAQFYDTTGTGNERGIGFIYTDSGVVQRQRPCCWPPAVCMVLISLLEVGFFWYDADHGKTPTDGPFAKIFIHNPNMRHEAWRFLTYMLVHVDLFHLFTNLLVQLFLGIPLEIVNRWWRVVIVYAAGGVAASLAESLAEPTLYMAGASGGVYALSTAHIATIIMNWSSMKTAVFQLIGFVLLVAKDVATAVYLRDNEFSYAAHYAGAGAGLLVGIGVLRNLDGRKWEKILCWAAVLLYLTLTLGAILANIFWKKRFLNT